MTQYGFFFDQSRCSGCHACTVACKNWNRLSPGPLKYLRVYEYEKGAFPNVRIHMQWIPCYHCEEPMCMKNCPCGAIYKDNKYGAVLIDSAKCDGCRICYDSCPYGAPVFESDQLDSKAYKCTMCVDRLDMGEMPICVTACPMRALDFGPLSAFIETHGDERDLEDLPDSQSSRPAVIFKPHNSKRNLVPYDVDRALELLMSRDPLPPVFGSIKDVNEIPPGTIGSGELVIKHTTSDDLMARTRNSEG
jgi:anaerobic dimethyl sulfoxide reductase subunit B